MFRTLFGSELVRCRARPRSVAWRIVNLRTAVTRSSRSAGRLLSAFEGTLGALWSIGEIAQAFTRTDELMHDPLREGPYDFSFRERTGWPSIHRLMRVIVDMAADATYDMSLRFHDGDRD